MKNVVCRKKPHQIWPYGLRDMACWSSRFCENDSIITCQPHMGIESSRTFWKWENKTFNFHVGQNFIWSFLDNVNLRRRPFHFWQVEITGPLLFLETFHLTSNSSLLMFETSNETCMDMNEIFLTLSHLQIHQLTFGWLFQLTDDLVMHKWFWASTTWWNGSHMKP